MNLMSRVAILPCCRQRRSRGFACRCIHDYKYRSSSNHDLAGRQPKWLKLHFSQGAGIFARCRSGRAKGIEDRDPARTEQPVDNRQGDGFDFGFAGIQKLEDGSRRHSE